MSEREVNLDLQRAERIGLEEAILCAHKTSAQIGEILDHIHADGASCLMTRLDEERYAAIGITYRSLIDYDEVSATGFFNWEGAAPKEPEIAIISAGSSDVPVAREALRTLQYFHLNALPIFDVGVAGLWRLLERIEDIKRFPVVICVAGMDVALPSVLGGLFPGLIVAVPTSVGYGVAAGGTTALHSMLASCSPGIVAVNIDNGYGAACAVLRVLHSRRHSAQV